MELITISEVSRDFSLSTRTLRYYEQIGLIKSTKKEDYAYRVYDEEAILRLQQIVILKKLNIPLKQIGEILNDENAKVAIEIFEQNVRDIKVKIDSLTIIKDILNRLITQLEKNQSIKVNLDLISDDDILNLIESPSLTNFNYREEKSMEDLNSASKNFEELKDVRIIHLPPCTVASCNYVGENPENNAQELLKDFVIRNNLYEIKPDARVFGFNSPCPTPDKPVYGYEYWVTIPNDMKVEKPYVKKYFKGGLYAAHMITLGNFNEWQWLSDWVKGNGKYLGDTVDDDNKEMGGLLEEAINYVYFTGNNKKDGDDNQLDLLYPIKIK